MVISVISSPRTVNRSTSANRPAGATTMPTASSTMAGSAKRAFAANIRALVATAAAPRIVVGEPAAVASTCNTTSPSSTASRPSKSPSRAAARNASTSRRWRTRSVVVFGVFPRTRCRARAASCAAVFSDRPTIGAISENGRSNMSCSTKARRSAGDRVCRMTSRATPTESASTASCSGSTGSTGCAAETWLKASSSGCSGRALRARNMSRQILATTVVNQARRLPTSPGSARSIRSHASCTASSASDNEPSIR